jgi:hypothetical protein
MVYTICCQHGPSHQVEGGTITDNLMGDFLYRY